ncbi:hypothetical protein DSO57_1016929 [Entomophthora muscae]|uniref:Uncharacterized protein n=1 Tax=Entomophthora muscae TaxID=34485 RepID=A0ACC2STW0_9FUNG|nr:hypothetical protein DSO57_1016929 [Entomophthora muscae]
MIASYPARQDKSNQRLCYPTTKQQLVQYSAQAPDKLPDNLLPEEAPFLSRGDVETAGSARQQSSNVHGVFNLDLLSPYTSDSKSLKNLDTDSLIILNMYEWEVEDIMDYPMVKTPISTW